MLYVDGVKYKLWVPPKEEDLENFVENNATKIFGEDVLYLPLKTKLKSLSGIGSIPDGYAIGLTKPYKWYIIEIELSTHPVFSHIVPQLNKFVQGLREPSSRKKIIEAVYNEIKKEPITEAYVKKKIGSGEIYRFLSSTIEKEPTLAVIIDEKTSELEEACDSIPIKEKLVSEFRIYERVDAGIKNAFLTDPLFVGINKAPPLSDPLGAPRRSWEEKLDWTNPEIKEITLTLKHEIETRFTNIIQRTSGSHYIFNKGKRGQKSRFAAIGIQKSKLAIRVRFDPETCVDRDGMLKDRVYSWFMKGDGQEREFYINDKDQIDSALELISQSYDLAE